MCILYFVHLHFHGSQLYLKYYLLNVEHYLKTLFLVTLLISLPSLRVLPLFKLSKVLVVSVVYASGVACAYSSISFVLCDALFCFLQKPGSMPKTDPHILDKVPGLLPLLTKNLFTRVSYIQVFHIISCIMYILLLTDTVNGRSSPKITVPGCRGLPLG